VTLADGSTRDSDRIVIRRVTLGNHTLSDVPAVVNPNGSDFLMPFTVLSKIGRFTTDATRGQRRFSQNLRFVSRFPVDFCTIGTVCKGRVAGG